MSGRPILAAVVLAGALLVATGRELPDQICYRPADVPAMNRAQLRAVYRCLDAAGWSHTR